MGKIFDALEKASKNTGNNVPQSPVKSAASYKKPDKGNIVSIADARGSILDEGLNPNLVAVHKPQSLEAELFKTLRTNLLFPSSGKPPKSILVTSAIPGDGKSFIAANLAISIAQGVEEHVLLIDADIRNPSINQFFGFKQKDGLAEYLKTGIDVSKNFYKSPIPKLTILPAGVPPSNPTELLTTQKMKVLLDEVANRYDDRYIIIDSAPPSLASETSAISQYVDGIIIVVKAGKTPRSSVAESIDQLGKDKILGIVLNYSDQYAKRYYGYGKSYLKSE